MNARLLGSGGWMPSGVRDTCCLLVRDRDEALVLDAGTGFRRLALEPELLDGVRALHLAFTHFHLDHVMGLCFLPGLERTASVWAPGRIAAGRPAAELLHRLLDPPFLLRTPDDLGRYVDAVHELEEGENRIGGFAVEARVQSLHTAASAALKVNGELAYCTDTSYDEGNVDFVRGATLLFHEAFIAADEGDENGHTAAGQAARLAAAAGVERLVLIHTHPQLADDEELLGFARPHFSATEVGRDGWTS